MLKLNKLLVILSAIFLLTSCGAPESAEETTVTEPDISSYYSSLFE